MGVSPRNGRAKLSSAPVRGEREKLLFIAGLGASIVVGLVLFLVAIIGSPSKTSSKTSSGDTFIQDDGATVALLAPEGEVEPGTKLSDVRLRTIQWPKDQAPEGSFTDPSQLAPLFAKVKLPAGIPIQKRHTTTNFEQPKVATMPLTPGNRAVSIDVDDTSGLEGHALPGTKVDVVLTYTQSGNLTSTIIVQNARVLSYGGDTTPLSAYGKERRPTKVMKTMTLDVSTQDALKIQTARQMGRLSLMLRAPEDDAASATLQFTGAELQLDRLAGKKAAATPAAVAACVKGKMKMGGKSYLLGCDGSMTPLE